MKKILFFKRLQENVRVSMVYLAFALMIASLTFACATGYKNQAASSANMTAKAPAKAESKNAKAQADKEIVCRTQTVTGSLFPRKICATKAQWAVIDAENSRKTDQFNRHFDQQTGVYTGSGAGVGGGESSGPAY